MPTEFRRNLTRSEFDLHLCSPSSFDLAEWQCSKCGHSWETMIRNRAISGSGCHACHRQGVNNNNVSRSMAPPGESLANLSPGITARFIRCLKDPTRTPDNLRIKSNLSYEWSCHTGKHTFTAPVFAVSSGAKRRCCKWVAHMAMLYPRPPPRTGNLLVSHVLMAIDATVVSAVDHRPTARQRAPAVGRTPALLPTPASRWMSRPLPRAHSRTRALPWRSRTPSGEPGGWRPGPAGRGPAGRWTPRAPAGPYGRGAPRSRSTACPRRGVSPAVSACPSPSLAGIHEWESSPLRPPEWLTFALTGRRPYRGTSTGDRTTHTTSLTRPACPSVRTGSPRGPVPNCLQVHLNTNLLRQQAHAIPGGTARPRSVHQLGLSGAA
ncbi:zinc-ribbon domain-containing protein [Streptomyces sp. CA-179760]|uniref:zinc-ribbon domain-containing protein n=1 Tax=Streptomyces sp. CA-179760 TaxID=3240054 RepID=UPI003D8B27FA